eukprot:3502326-Amphidinium_carterae.1
MMAGCATHELCTSGCLKNVKFDIRRQSGSCWLAEVRRQKEGVGRGNPFDFRAWHPTIELQHAYAVD